MTLEDYAYALKRACWLNMPSPVKEWRRLQREVGEVCAWLDAMEIKRLHVESEDINLKVPAGDNRRFVGVVRGQRARLRNIFRAGRARRGGDLLRGPAVPALRPSGGRGVPGFFRRHRLARGVRAGAALLAEPDVFRRGVRAAWGSFP